MQSELFLWNNMLDPTLAALCGDGGDNHEEKEQTPLLSVHEIMCLVIFLYTCIYNIGSVVGLVPGPCVMLSKNVISPACLLCSSITSLPQQEAYPKPSLTTLTSPSTTSHCL